MPRKKIEPSPALIGAHWKAMAKAGLEPMYTKINYLDGTFRIMTRKAVEAKYAAQGFTGSKKPSNPWDEVLNNGSA